MAMSICLSVRLLPKRVLLLSSVTVCIVAAPPTPQVSPYVCSPHEKLLPQVLRNYANDRGLLVVSITHHTCFSLASGSFFIVAVT